MKFITLSTIVVALAFSLVEVRGQGCSFCPDDDILAGAAYGVEHRFDVGVYTMFDDLSKKASDIHEDAVMACQKAETLGCSVTSWNPQFPMSSPNTVHYLQHVTHGMEPLFDLNMETVETIENDGINGDLLFKKKTAILTFLSSFCNSLKSHGSLNLAHMHDCSFTLPESDSNDVLASFSASELTFDRPSKAVITMQGLTEDFSDGDLAVIEECSLSAFNDAFSFFHISLEFFESSLFAIERVAVANTASEVGDNSLSILIGQTVFVGIKQALEQQLLSNEHTITHLKYLHSAVEKEICSKLKASSSTTFSNVHGCTFNILHDPLEIQSFNDKQE